MSCEVIGRRLIGVPGLWDAIAWHTHRRFLIAYAAAFPDALVWRKSDMKLPVRILTSLAAAARADSPPSLAASTHGRALWSW